MQPSDEQRVALVEAMKARGAVRTSDVEAALVAVPRHLFLPTHIDLQQAYSDVSIPLKYDGDGMLISQCIQPSAVAQLLDQAQLRPGDNVLQIGTSNGYVAAVIKHIVGEAGRVTALEIDGEQVRQTQHNLRDAHAGDVTVAQVDGVQGYSPRAQYDCIVSLVGVWDVPLAWLRQLKPTGCLIVPMWLDGVQVTAVLRPDKTGQFLSVHNRPSEFVYMRGANSNVAPLIRKRVGSSSLFVLADEISKIDTAALHLLLSDDHEFAYLESPLTPQDYWNGLQIFMMLHEPTDMVFAVYGVVEGRKAYGLEKNGVVLFGPASAAFASYYDRNVVHSFAGADAYLRLQHLLDRWNDAGRPTVERLRVRLIPKTQDKPTTHRVYERNHYYVQAWLDEDELT